MAAASRTLQLIASNLLIPLAIFVFAIGFFPYKPFLPGLAEWDTDEYPRQPAAPFDKLIFMVVDALRSDFVYAEPSGFSFVQSLIKDGAALPFTAHATSPTITMPRIKAITTGSTPSFLDLILNFAESDKSSSLAHQDTWLAQIKARKRGEMIMFGDDTWLKLFPDTFDRSDGTSSFFVADFTEVDSNVTRHVPVELANPRWNTMVLHYLGLDHIGHKTGPRGPNMIPKQQEMDAAVKSIYEAMQTQKHLSNALLVVCGDHGMNDAGNHGGSAPGETSPALVFASPKFKKVFFGKTSPLAMAEDFRYYSHVEQADLAPTLASLLGFPIPKNNLGAIMMDFLPMWKKLEDKLQILVQNAKQILKIIRASAPPEMFQDSGLGVDDCSTQSGTAELACRWRGISRRLKAANARTKEDSTVLLQDLSTWTKDAGHSMSSTASNYDIKKLLGGQVLAVTALILALYAAWPHFAVSETSALPFFGMTVAYGTLMFASSFIEEEHQFWYWTTSGWCAFLSLKEVNKFIYTRQRRFFIPIGAVLALSGLRVMRRWNQTGQKLAGEPDIARTFLTVHPVLLWILVVATYVSIAYNLYFHGFPRQNRTLIALQTWALLLFTLIFKISFTLEDAPELVSLLVRQGDGRAWDWIRRLFGNDGTWTLINKARLVFSLLLIALQQALTKYFSQKHRTGLLRTQTTTTVSNILALFLLTQTRTRSIPLFALLSLIASALSLLPLSPLESTTTIILLQHATFFAFGGANAISSIDLSNAYNGISGFNVIAVGALTVIGNWAGTVWWAAAGAEMLAQADERRCIAAKIPIARNSEATGGVPEPKLDVTNPSTLEPNSPSDPDSAMYSSENARRPSLSTLQGHIAFLTVFISAHLVFVMLACTVLRAHLFIWTVFSPKFLYSIAWCLVVHFTINLGVGVAVYALRRC